MVLMGNTFKTALLLTALTMFLLLMGQYFGGQNGLIVGLLIALLRDDCGRMPSVLLLVLQSIHLTFPVVETGA